MIPSLRAAGEAETDIERSTWTTLTLLTLDGVFRGHDRVHGAPGS